MSINNSQRGGFPSELAATMTGSWVTIGSLLYNPVAIIFDNQGTNSVAISVNGGTTTWRTFTPSEAIILDLRNQHGIASNFTFDLGTTFSGNGAGGTFSISYIYALSSGG
jgi:hypothetical protein